MTPHERKIFLCAIDKYGIKNQCVVAIEELSELQKELTKYLRGQGNMEHLAEEMADVGIMLDQLNLAFCLFRASERWRQKKVERLLNRVTNRICKHCAHYGPDTDDIAICGKSMTAMGPEESCLEWKERETWN